MSLIQSLMLFVLIWDPIELVVFSWYCAIDIDQWEGRLQTDAVLTELDVVKLKQSSDTVVDDIVFTDNIMILVPRLLS